MAIYALKLLRKKTGSYKRLSDWLFNPQKLAWAARFKHEFEDVPQRLFFIPSNVNPSADVLEMRRKWEAIKDKDFPEAEFLDMIGLTRS